MKSVAILTLYYKNYNYGGQLQAFALQKTIQNFGYNCVQISFERQRKDVFWRKIRAIMRESIVEKRKYLLGAFNKIQRKIRKIPLDQATFNKFEQWIDRIPHTNLVNRDTIYALNDQYDYFVVGSDQVWNPEFVPKTFFLDFVMDDKKKIAYSASIRINKFEKKESKEIKNLISRFSHISVRENTAKELLKNIGIKQNIDLNLDPTLLINKEEWDKVAVETELDQPYIFSYLIKDPYALKQIREFAIINKCKVVCVNTPGYITDENDIFIRVKSGVGPAEFIGLIKNAKFVFVESFHGIVFSLIYEKQFLVYAESSDDRKKTLLDLVGLLSRSISSDTICQNFRFDEIDYNEVLSVLDKKRQESLFRLKSYLE